MTSLIVGVSGFTTSRAQDINLSLCNGFVFVSASVGVVGDASASFSSPRPLSARGACACVVQLFVNKLVKYNRIGNLSYEWQRIGKVASTE